MARTLRVEYPGVIYHVMNRGDRRELIFKDDEDRQRFLATLGEVCDKTGWQVHALCLMRSNGSRTFCSIAGGRREGNEYSISRTDPSGECCAP